MNKEQAIAALETERLNSSEAVIVVENGARYFTAPTLYNAGLNKAIDILRSLPDETPTVKCWTLDKILSVLDYATTHNEFATLTSAQVIETCVRLFTDFDGPGSPLFLDGPDETPTVLTREKLDELIAQTEPERCANCEYAGMREASAAMDGLRDYPTVQPLCDYHEGVGRLRDALLALGPVVVEGPVECGYDNIAEGVTSERVHAVMALQGRKYCSDCGARLSKGNNDES